MVARPRRSVLAVRPANRICAPATATVRCLEVQAPLRELHGMGGGVESEEAVVARKTNRTLLLMNTRLGVALRRILRSVPAAFARASVTV